MLEQHVLAIERGQTAADHTDRLADAQAAGGQRQAVLDGADPQQVAGEDADDELRQIAAQPRCQPQQPPPKSVSASVICTKTGSPAGYAGQLPFGRAGPARPAAPTAGPAGGSPQRRRQLIEERQIAEHASRQAVSRLGGSHHALAGIDRHHEQVSRGQHEQHEQRRQRRAQPRAARKRSAAGCVAEGAAGGDPAEAGIRPPPAATDWSTGLAAGLAGTAWRGPNQATGGG